MKPKQTKPATKPTDSPQDTLPQGQKLEPHKVLLYPEAQSAIRMLDYGGFAGEVDVSVLARHMAAVTTEVKAGNLGRMERMLAAQAFSLDTLFTHLSRQARVQVGLSQLQTFMGLALKAQAQCRATIEALAEIKNPKAATFVRQANIAHQQQVNNGEAALPAPAPAQLAPPAPDALADMRKQTGEPVPLARAREHPEASKAD